MNNSDNKCDKGTGNDNSSSISICNNNKSTRTATTTATAATSAWVSLSARRRTPGQPSPACWGSTACTRCLRGPLKSRMTSQMLSWGLEIAVPASTYIPKVSNGNVPHRSKEPVLRLSVLVETGLNPTRVMSPNYADPQALPWRTTTNSSQALHIQTYLETIGILIFRANGKQETWMGPYVVTQNMNY